MEMRRTIIIIALAVVSYLLLINWQKDYGPKPETEASTATIAPEAKPAADVPAATAAAAPSANSDIPVAPQKKTDTALPVTSAPSTSLVHVATDVLNVAIDPVGGDIVEIALPKYTKHINTNQPFVLLENNRSRTYVAQSGLVGTNGPDAAATGRPHYSASATSYVLDKADQVQAVLTHTDASGALIEKIFTFKRGSYLIDVTYRITNHGSQNWSGTMFGQLKRDASVDPSASGSKLGLQTYLGSAYWSTEKPYNKLPFDKFEEKPLKETVKGGWAAIVQHYFVTAWIPGKNDQNSFSTRQNKEKGEHIIGYMSPDIVVAPNAQKSVSASLYAGPKIQKSLEAISPGLELTVDYGMLWPIAQFLFALLNLIHTYLFSNWGLSIIMLTIVVKGAFWHLSATSYRSMANMRRVAPEMQRMKEQFGDDRQKMSQAMMDLYRKEKINPLGGCLPMLVQMPVFIALYWTLVESVELRHAGFFLWIKDLADMDPYYVLPLLMGASMFIQSRLNPEPPDPMQAKMMKIMPVIFTVFFLWFPAGLVLYWLVSNIISILQQWYITRQIEGASAKK